VRVAKANYRVCAGYKYSPHPSSGDQAARGNCQNDNRREKAQVLRTVLYCVAS
jgi:hypothetical protein